MACEAAAASGKRVAWVCSFLGTLGCASTGDPPGHGLEFAVEATVDEPAHGVAQLVWGLEASDAVPELDPEAVASLLATVQGPAEQGPTEDRAPGPGPRAAEQATLRARFGSSVLIAPDGSITKQYFLSGEAGRVFLNLLQDPALIDGDPVATTPATAVRIGGTSPSQSILGQMLGDQEVEFLFLKDFEVAEAVQIRSLDPVKAPTFTGQPPPLSRGDPTNLLLVTAQADALAAFEGALNLFFANIPQIEIEVKVVEYNTTDAVAFGVNVLNPGSPTMPPTITQQRSGTLIGDIVSQFPLAAPSPTGTEFSDRGIITLGGIHDSWELNAQLEMLEATGVADILTSPRLVVRNGGTASVTTNTDIPYPQASISSSGQNVTSNIAFKPVGISLNIRPVVAGNNTIILQVFAKVSAVIRFADTKPVATPVVATREVVTSVHLNDGNTTVIGGLVTSSTFDFTTQVPILGDIPILGYLFRSTSTTTEKTTLEFHITPRIIRGERTYAGGE